MPEPIPWESIARTAREVRSPTPTDAEALLQQLSPENLDREGFLQVWQPQPDETDAPGAAVAAQGPRL
jgi:hypothetical protein